MNHKLKAQVLQVRSKRLCVKNGKKPEEDRQTDGARLR